MKPFIGVTVAAIALLSPPGFAKSKIVHPPEAVCEINLGGPIYSGNSFKEFGFFVPQNHAEVAVRRVLAELRQRISVENAVNMERQWVNIRNGDSIKLGNFVGSGVRIVGLLLYRLPSTNGRKAKNWSQYPFGRGHDNETLIVPFEGMVQGVVTEKLSLESTVNPSQALPEQADYDSLVIVTKGVQTIRPSLHRELGMDGKPHLVRVAEIRMQGQVLIPLVDSQLHPVRNLLEHIHYLDRASISGIRYLSVAAAYVQL